MKTKQTIAMAVMGAALLGLHGGRGNQTAANAQTPPPVLSHEAALSLKTLQNPGYFAIGGVGFAGQMSPGENALRVLLKEKNAPTLLRGLFQSANPAGQLYALVGIRQFSQSEFAWRVAGFRTRTTSVKTFQGCVGDTETMAAVAARIEKRGPLSPTPQSTPPPPKPTK